MSQKDSFWHVKRVLWIVLALNWGVAVAKVIVGNAIGSASMAADGFHSFSDGTSNIVGLIGIWLASRPIDRDHPYGHKKFETFSALGIAALLGFVAVNIAREALERFYNPVIPNTTGSSFAVMVITLAVNISVMRYEYLRGRALKSSILVSDSYHTKSDIFVSISVLVTLAGVRLGFPAWIDPAASLVIAVFIAWAAWEVIRGASGVLCDAAIMDPESVRAVALTVEGVRECHNVRSRGREDDANIDLHILVEKSLSIEEAHQTAHTVEDRIRESFPGVADVIVHLEPYNPEPGSSTGYPADENFPLEMSSGSR